MRTSSFVLLSVLLTAVFVFFSCDNEVSTIKENSSVAFQTRTFPACSKPNTYKTIASYSDYMVWAANPTTSARFTGNINFSYGSIVPYSGCNVEIATGANITNIVNIQITAGNFVNKGTLSVMANIMITTANNSSLNNGSSMTAGGAIMITAGNTMNHNGSLNASGSIHLTSNTLNFGSTGYLHAAGDIAIDIMGSAVSVFDGTIINSNSLEINAINLNLTADGEIKGNGTTEIVVTGTMNDSSDIKNNGNVCIATGSYKLENSYEFTSNASCVIGGNIISGSLPLSGCTRGYAPCGGGSPQCSAGQTQDQACGNGGTQTRICENGLWGEWSECSGSQDPCTGYQCGSNSHCENISGTATCICDTDYILENGTCINSKQVSCTDAVPANATSVIAPVTITYTTANGWSTPANCNWSCNTDYINESGICINSKQVNCTDNAPANATSNTVPVTITYTTAGGWTTPANCNWSCNTDYINESGICINSKQVNCNDNAPANATSDIVPVTITYTTANGWTAPANCNWNCNTDFVSEDSATCINSKEVNCVDSAPANAASTVIPVTITFTTANGWSTPANCAWNCINDFVSEDGQNCINSKIVDCIPDPLAPDYSGDEIAPVTINYTSADGWEAIPYCSWTCIADYIFDNGSCINSKQVNCTDNSPANATSDIVPVTITYTTANGWSVPENCEWNCNEGYENLGDGQCTLLSNACNGITCSGHGTCSPSDVLELRVGGSGNDTLRGMALSNSGTLAYGGYTDGIMTGVLSLNTYEQLVAGITDDMLNHILFVQNEEDGDNALKDIAYGNGIFAALVQGVYWQMIVTVSSDGTTRNDINLSVPFGAEKIAVTSAGTFIVAGSDSINEISSTGSVIWAQQLNSTDWMRIESVDINNAGNIAVSGTVEGDLFSISNGGRDAFIAVFNSSGTLLWGVQTGTSGSDQDVAVSFDNSGNVITSFNTDGSFSGLNAGFMDAALVKYSGVDGTEIWRTQTGTEAFDAPFSVTVSPEDQIFVAGATLGSIDGNINEGAGVYGMNTADVFVTEFDGNGVKYSTVTYGDVLHDWIPVKIEAAGSNIVYVAGNTGHIDFDKGVLYSDMFILKMNLDGTADFPECTCDEGYFNVNNECIAEQTCSALDCGTAGTCEIKNRQPVCICSEGYIFNGISCVENSCEGIDCSGNGQCQPDQNNGPICSCYEGFTNDGNPLQCINSKEVPCVNSGSEPPLNAHFKTSTIYWNPYSGWTDPEPCLWECNEDYIEDNGICINEKTVPCTPNENKPLNSQDIISDIVIYYTTLNGWSSSSCKWECDAGFVNDWGTCVNTKTVKCISDPGKPLNSIDIFSYVEIYLSEQNEWSEPSFCSWECSQGFSLIDGQCVGCGNMTCGENRHCVEDGFQYEINKIQNSGSIDADDVVDIDENGFLFIGTASGNFQGDPLLSPFMMQISLDSSWSIKEYTDNHLVDIKKKNNRIYSLFKISKNLYKFTVEDISGLPVYATVIPVEIETYYGSATGMDVNEDKNIIYIHKTEYYGSYKGETVIAYSFDGEEIWRSWESGATERLAKSLYKNGKYYILRSDCRMLIIDVDNPELYDSDNVVLERDIVGFKQHDCNDFTFDDDGNIYVAGTTEMYASHSVGKVYRISTDLSFEVIYADGDQDASAGFEQIEFYGDKLYVAGAHWFEGLSGKKFIYSSDCYGTWLFDMFTVISLDGVTAPSSYLYCNRDQSQILYTDTLNVINNNLDYIYNEYSETTQTENISVLNISFNIPQCVCDQGYAEFEGVCLSSRTVSCYDWIPFNSTPLIDTVVIYPTPEGYWLRPDCEYICNPGFELDYETGGCDYIPEECNGIDDNGNGLVDENLYRECEEVCTSGTETCVEGIWSGCIVRDPEPEICDNIDNDCDGIIDNNVFEMIPCGKNLRGDATRTCTNGQWGLWICSDPDE